MVDIINNLIIVITFESFILHSLHLGSREILKLLSILAVRIFRSRTLGLALSRPVHHLLHQALLSLGLLLGSLLHILLDHGVHIRILQHLVDNNLLKQLEASLSEIKEYANDEGGDIATVKSIVSNADMDATSRRSAIHDAATCSKLDTLSSQMIAWHEAQLKKVDNAIAEEEARKAEEEAKKAREDAHRAEEEGLQQERLRAIADRQTIGVDSAGTEQSTQAPAPVEVESTPAPKPKPKTKVISRSAVLPTKALKSEEDVNTYVEEFRSRLLAELEGNDSIRLGQ